MKRIRREADRTARQIRDDLVLIGTLCAMTDETDIRMAQFPLLFAGGVDENGNSWDCAGEDAWEILEALDEVMNDADAKAMWDHWFDTQDERWLFNLAEKHGIPLFTWRINPMFTYWA